MSFKVDADLVELFRGIVSSIQPYAKSQKVLLHFESSVPKQNSYYHPKEIIPDFAFLIAQIISFTPQNYKVLVSIDKSASNTNALFITIKNTGVNLSYINEIHSSIKFKIKIERLKDNGTLFMVEVPIEVHPDAKINLTQEAKHSNSFFPYYAEITKRLKTHFGSVSEIEAFALQKDYNQGVFLKKINAIISSHLTDNDFNVDSLANAVALSRTQLFRKIKQLTKMSPGRYILFFRLQKAKELLQAKDKDFNVSEVCFKVGFVSKSHFTRSFQKQFGFNPSECH